MGLLSGVRVVVTGGAGNVGSHIVDAALATGAREVVALDALVRGVPDNLSRALVTGRARHSTALMPGEAPGVATASPAVLRAIQDMLRLDFTHVDRCLPRLDLAILLRTIPAVISRSGAA